MRQSGAPHVAAAGMPANDFRTARGTTQRYVAGSDAGNEIARVFGDACGTPLYLQVSTRLDIVGARACTVDDASLGIIAIPPCRS